MSSLRIWNILLVLKVLFKLDSTSCCENVLMSDRKRKFEDIVLDLKSGSGKKLKSGQTTTTENSNMAANNENSASGSNMDSMDSGGLCLRTLLLNISRDLNESINGIN